jgi:adenine-specific DNA-methyltransferase
MSLHVARPVLHGTPIWHNDVQMNEMFEKLLQKLKELFQLNQPELDFGIYRIMHAKSDEITKFLEQDLLPQVKDALSGYQSVDRARVERELDEAINQAKGLGVDPDSVEKVKILRAQLADAPNAEAVEVEVYEALYKFFRRYYTQGDFLSRRVYKKDVYAIPYEGEEVALHWANKDQYYIKSSETLRDYAFRLRPEDASNSMRVHFRVVGADEEEHNTVKTAEGKQRVFILAPNRTPEVVDGELHIYFQYEQSDKKQNDLNAKTADWFKVSASKDLIEWKTELLRLAPIKSNESRTLLEKHLEQYTARNTFDYFIHKDLGGFLRRELDFFIKNEIMHLDDIEDATAERADQYLAKIKAVKNVAVKIITFLAELEDFQKKLWLKKKFVVSTELLVSIRLLPDQVLQEVLQNQSQLKEWKELHHADEIESSLLTPGWGKKPTIEFLRAYPTLMLDTRHFDTAFTERVSDLLQDVDAQTSGVLIHSENIQAIRKIARKYSNSIDCVHIDPPYNTATSGFLYPNTYQHSSWLSMMAERLEATKKVLAQDGYVICHIDENEYERLHLLCEQLGLGDAGTMIWDKKNPMLGRKGLATQHEYVLWRTSLDGSVYLRNANQRRILAKAAEIIAKHKSVTESAQKEFSQWITKAEGLSNGERVYRQLDAAGGVFRGVSMEAPEQRTDQKFFRPFIHPSTGKPCPVPKSGWSRAPETIDELLVQGRIIFGKDDSTLPQLKVFMTDDSRRQAPSVLSDASRGKTDVQHLGLEFPYCHPLSLYVEIVGASTDRDDAVVLDYFAGSGTNGHAVIALNRDEGTNRRFILAEVGHHFDTVLIPRIKKASFCADWKNGKPQLPENGTTDLWSPSVVRVIRLEQYEDTLNNLDLKRPAGVEELFTGDEITLREEYVLKYMLDVETRGSASLLDMSAFSDPRKYTLRVKSRGTDETVETTVDLLETFNWLLGLRVQHVAASETYSTEFSNKDKRTVAKLKSSQTGSYWFRQVTGTLPDGREALIVWRTLSDDAAHDEAVLLAWFESKGHLASESLDVVYINGDCNLGASKPPGARWSVESLEAHFHELMFEGSES